MPAVRYIARRSFTGGVTNGQQVTYTLPLRYAGMTRAREAFGFKRRSLARVAEAYYYTGEYTYQLSSRALNPTEAASMTMFLDSVEDGQVFEFTLDETVSPIDWDNYIAADAYEAVRHPQLDSYTSFNFAIVGHP